MFMKLEEAEKRIPHTLGRPGGLYLKGQISLSRKRNGHIYFTAILLGTYYDATWMSRAGKKFQLGDEMSSADDLGKRIMEWGSFLESFFLMRGQKDVIDLFLSELAQKLFWCQGRIDEFLERQEKAEAMAEFSSPQMELEFPPEASNLRQSDEGDNIWEFQEAATA